MIEALACNRGSRVVARPGGDRVGERVLNRRAHDSERAGAVEAGGLQVLAEVFAPGPELARDHLPEERARPRAARAELIPERHRRDIQHALPLLRRVRGVLKEPDAHARSAAHGLLERGQVGGHLCAALHLEDYCGHASHALYWLPAFAAG